MSPAAKRAVAELISKISDAVASSKMSKEEAVDVLEEVGGSCDMLREALEEESER